MQFELRSTGDRTPYGITDQVQRLVQRQGKAQGMCFVTLPGSGVSLLSVECPEGDETPLYTLISEAQQLSSEPCFLATILGNALQFPVVRGQIQRATWQEIFLVDFMPVPRLHQIHVCVVPM